MDVNARPWWFLLNQQTANEDDAKNGRNGENSDNNVKHGSWFKTIEQTKDQKVTNLLNFMNGGFNRGQRKAQGFKRRKEFTAKTQGRKEDFLDARNLTPHNAGQGREEVFEDEGCVNRCLIVCRKAEGICNQIRFS